MLQRIELPRHLDSLPVPTPVHAMVHDLRLRIEAFQDRWDVDQIEQFVAADYELVYQTLAWIRQSQLMIGNRFCEWGCGFAAVTVIADSLGWDCIGIESERTLIAHGRKTVADWCQTLRGKTETPSASLPELFEGNFLPRGAERMADDPTLPSLSHACEPVYSAVGLEVDDFSVIYSYPWPGEDEFHEQVFDRYAARGAILVQFCGPHEMRAWRAVAHR